MAKVKPSTSFAEHTVNSNFEPLTPINPSMKIGQKLTIGYLSIAFFVGVMGYFSARAISKTQQEFNQLTRRVIPEQNKLHNLKNITNAISKASIEIESDSIDSRVNQSLDILSIASDNPTVKNQKIEQKIYRIEQLKKDFYASLFSYETLINKRLDEEAYDFHSFKSNGIKLIQLVDSVIQLQKTPGSRAILLQKKDELKRANEELITSLNITIDQKNTTLELTKSEIETTLSVTIQHIYVIGCLAFVVAILSSGWITISLTRPLNKLKAAAIKIGQGRLRVKIDVVGKDELSELVQTFNTMAEELWRTTTYAVKVRESLVESLIVLTPNSLRIHSVNKATCQLLGCNRGELIGQPIDRFLPDIAALLKEERLGQLSEQGFIHSIETIYKTKSGSQIPVLFSASLMRENHEVLGIVCVAQDNTVRYRHEATIRYQASHDLLTGLPNRALFNNQLSIALEQAIQNQTQLAVLFIDLDRFKLINDTLGHAIGDRILQGFSQRITNCLRQNDAVARWGGDEFTVLLPNIRTLDEATTIAHRILNALKPHFEIEGHVLRVSSSIGIAIYPTDGIDAETLLKNADAALYRAKEGGRNSYCLYTAAINSQASEQLTLENQLHRALDQHEFELHYQPLVNTETGQISQMEALLRWHHPEMGIVPPNRFIPLAEENGLIVAIGEWVLRMACAQTRAWHDAGLSKIRVGVNLSAQQFRHPDLVDTISQILQETQLDPRFLELEITETTVMTNVEQTKTILDELTTMGISIAMDDFGNGYSSLSYLKKFPFHTLKIDRAFIRDLTTDPNDRAIVTAIAALGRVLNLKLVAEGVETEVQERILRSLDCHEMQGYFFSPPVQAEEATKLLQNPQFAHRLLAV